MSNLFKNTQLFFSLSLIVFFLLASNHVNAELTDTSLLKKKLRQGGYVLYLRHAASNRNQTDTDTDDLNDCSKQRNLSSKGREQARVIGKAIKALNIPIGTVTTSPYCRCVDTANLAFGYAVKSNDLRFTISEDEEETKRLSTELKKMLSTAPKKGSNSVIVGHTGNLKEAAKVWPKPEGALHVFQPMGNNEFKHLGRIAPDQWQQ